MLVASSTCVPTRAAGWMTSASTAPVLPRSIHNRGARVRRSLLSRRRRLVGARRVVVMTDEPTPREPTPRDDADAPTEPGARFRHYVLPELELLHAMARRLTWTSTEAEDLVQDTMLRAFRAIERFDGRHPRAWVLTILRNTHINRIRKKRPDLAFDPDATFGRLPADDGRDTVSEDAVNALGDPDMVAALGELTDDHRAVLALVDVDGLSYREAAELLDVPIGTVMSRLHRARKNLRTALEQRGGLGEVAP